MEFCQFSESVIMIIPNWTLPPFLKANDCFTGFVSQLSDDFGSLVHCAKKWVNFWVRFKQNNAGGGNNLLKKVTGDREIYRHKIFEIGIKFNFWIEFKVR